MTRPQSQCFAAGPATLYYIQTHQGPVQCQTLTTGPIEPEREAMAEIQYTEFWPKCELMSKNSLRLSICERFIAIPAGREFLVALNKSNGPDAASVLVKRIDW